MQKCPHCLDSHWHRQCLGSSICDVEDVSFTSNAWPLQNIVCGYLWVLMLVTSFTIATTMARLKSLNNPPYFDFEGVDMWPSASAMNIFRQFQTWCSPETPWVVPPFWDTSVHVLRYCQLRALQVHMSLSPEMQLLPASFGEWKDSRLRSKRYIRPIPRCHTTSTFLYYISIYSSSMWKNF